jgi:predicted dithiol-disulfide oxidoreductase (DUF899 family)
VRIEILDEAQEDLIEGIYFYENRETGVGSYFLDCLFSDIDSLILYQEFIKSFTDITAACPSVSLLRSTTTWKEN